MPVYSHSRLSSFENCPKQFHFRYVLKIPAESESVEAFVGKRVHEVLERLYRFVAEQKLPSIERVLARFRANWDDSFDDARVRVVRDGLDPRHYRELGERCLRNFYRRHYPFDAEETLGLEQNVHFSLDDGGRYRMRGVVDRIARTRDGAVEIQDYKTGGRLPSQRALDVDRQLALYQLALADRFEDAREVRLVWHFLQQGVTRVSTRSREQLDELRARTITLIDRVEAEQRFDAKPGPLCGWCEYRDRCPAMTGARSPHAAGEPAPAMVAPRTASAAAPALAQRSLFETTASAALAPARR